MQKMASASTTKSGGNSGKKMTMASALVGEKLAHWRADIRLGLYKLAHPSLPKPDREAAEESNIVQKSVATVAEKVEIERKQVLKSNAEEAERRRQQEARARAIANEKKFAKRKAQAMRAGFSSPL